MIVFVQFTYNAFRCKNLTNLSFNSKNVSFKYWGALITLEKEVFCMGLNCFMISDDSGIPFYSRAFNGFKLLDDTLLSGLISAIGSVGMKLFKQEIATISFGTGAEASYMAVVTRELFSAGKTINFVFFYTGTIGDLQLKAFRELSTTIFMETKLLFRTNAPNMSEIREKINKLLDQRFSKLGNL